MSIYPFLPTKLLCSYHLVLNRSISPIFCFNLRYTRMWCARCTLGIHNWRKREDWAEGEGEPWYGPNEPQPSQTGRELWESRAFQGDLVLVPSGQVLKLHLAQAPNTCCVRNIWPQVRPPLELRQPLRSWEPEGVCPTSGQRVLPWRECGWCISMSSLATWI